VLWQATPRVDVSPEKAKALTERIQDAGTEVVKAKVILSTLVHFPEQYTCIF
jgi:hypothetical protein